MREKRKCCFLALLVVLCCLLSGCSWEGLSDRSADSAVEGGAATLDKIPAFSGDAYVTIHNGQPQFDEKDYTTESFETYAELDSLGRCGAAYANIGKDLMPTGERGNISPVKPSGWQSAKYDCVEGKYLYNRCHLIGFQLTGENANKKNLITGTRFLNVEGMLPFENQVAEYIRETGNHVLYRVTPIYEGDNLVAGGVEMEARSVEDDGEGVCFHVYAYNVQPGVTIDYATGESHLSGDTKKETTDTPAEYVLNTNTQKYHLPDCSSVADTKKENKETFKGSKDELERQGYKPCGRCRP